MNKQMDKLSILLASNQLWLILSKRRKRHYYLLVCFILISSLLELLSIGSLVPLVKGIGDPEYFYDVYVSKTFIKEFIPNDSGLVVATLGVAFASIAIVAAIFKIIVIWGTSRVAFGSGAEITQHVYAKLINRPYDDYKLIKSSELLDVISGKISSLINSIIIPALYFINSLLMTLIITIGLLFIDYKAAITIFLLYGSMYGFLLIKTRATLARNSKTISEGSAGIIKFTQIALGSMRNIIIDQNAEFFNKKFKNLNINLRRAQANSVFIGNSPKNILEAFALVLISIIAISKSNEPGSISSVAAVVGVIAMAAQRLLPLMQQAFSAWTSFRENRESLFEITKFVNSKERFFNSSSLQEFHSSIEFENVGYKYYQNSMWALRPFSFRVTKGECVAVMGKTGAGKSTLLDLLLGLLVPTTGQIKVDEIPVNLYNNKIWYKNISHVPQSVYLIDGTIAENIAFGMSDSEIDYTKLQLVSSLAQVSEFAAKLSGGIGSQVGEDGSMLSGGQRQRIGIARALYKSSELLILDEATSALDHKTEMEIFYSIKKAYPEITIISVTHNKESIKAYDRVIEL